MGKHHRGCGFDTQAQRRTLIWFDLPLLSRSDGKKFGKSESGAIWLAPDRCSPYDFYQYFFRMPDADVIRHDARSYVHGSAEICDYEDKMQEKGMCQTPLKNGSLKR